MISLLALASLQCCSPSCMLLQVNRCLSIKGAEDVLNRPHAFEISTVDSNMFFIADSDKVCASACINSAGLHGRQQAECLSRICCWQDKEDWINAVGRAIVRHSKRCVLKLVLHHLPAWLASMRC